MNIRGGFQELTIKLAADNGGVWNPMFDLKPFYGYYLRCRHGLSSSAVGLVNNDREGHRWQHYTGRWKEAMVEI